MRLMTREGRIEHGEDGSCWPRSRPAPLAVAMPATAQEAKKPNILFIMGDDIGWKQPSTLHHALMVEGTPSVEPVARECKGFEDLSRDALA